MASPSDVLAEAITLPISKKTLSNRLAKAALTECLAHPRNGLPNKSHYELYRRWANGGSALIITGNVMVDRNWKEAPRNVVLDSTNDIAPFRKWADSIRRTNLQNTNCASTPLAIMQLSHPGRQSTISTTGLLSRPLAPTGGPKNRVNLPTPLGTLLSNLFLHPRQLTTEQLPTIISQFATAAHHAETAGFDGVEIHAAHGYLLSQFLSPTGNNSRTDGYGGTPVARRRLLCEIIGAVRGATEDGFVVGVKVNAKDRGREGVEEETERLDLIEALGGLGTLDYINLSTGGSYEDPLFVRNVNGGGPEGADGNFCVPFAARLRDRLGRGDRGAASAGVRRPLVMITGGFRTAIDMEMVISSGNADLVGLGRPLCIDPDVPNNLLADRQFRALTPVLTFPCMREVMEPALNSLWYQRQIGRLSQGRDAETDLRGWGVLFSILGMFLRTYLWDWKGVCGGGGWLGLERRQKCD